VTTLARQAPRVIAILLIVAAGLFVIGVTSEGNEDTHSDEPTAETGEHDEATEAGEGTETPTAEPADGETGENEERVLGIDLESPLAIVGAVVVSVLLAGLVWRRPTRRLLVVIAVVAAAFAVLDIAEVVRQVDENRAALALLAGVIATAHAAAAALALHQTTTGPVAAHPAATTT
jgi:hypothetical protein